MSLLPIVDKFLRLVVVLTVSPAKLYAVKDKLKIRQKSTEISREYPILMRVTVSWLHHIKLTILCLFHLFL